MAHRTHVKPDASRRQLLKMASSLPAVAAIASLGPVPQLLATVAAQGRHIRGHNPALIPDTKTLGAWLQHLADILLKVAFLQKHR